MFRGSLLVLLVLGVFVFGFSCGVWIFGVVFVFLGGLGKLLLMVLALLLLLLCFLGFLDCLRFLVCGLLVAHRFLVLGLAVLGFGFFLLLEVAGGARRTLCRLFGGFCFCLFLLL